MMPGEYIYEFVPVGESVKNWSQLFTVTFYPMKNMPDNLLDKLVNDVRLQILADSKNKASWNILSRNEDSITYEWAVTEPYLKLQIQHEIARVVKTSKGIHSLAYVQKVPALDEKTKEIWLKIISEAHKDEELDKIVRGSFHFTKGTECLDKKDYINAIYHLKKAVELDPLTARNLENLGCAYAYSGDTLKGLYYTTLGFFCESPTETARFKQIWEKLKEEPNLTQKEIIQCINFHCYKRAIVMNKQWPPKNSKNF